MPETWRHRSSRGSDDSGTVRKFQGGSAETLSNYTATHGVSVQSLSTDNTLRNAVDKLKRYQRLKSWRSNRRGQGSRSPSGGRWSCTCGVMGCQSKVPRGRSPDSGLPGPKETIDHRSRHQDAGLSPSPGRPGGTSPSPGWRARQEEEPRRRGITFPATATGSSGETVSNWR